MQRSEAASKSYARDSQSRRGSGWESTVLVVIWVELEVD